MMWSIPTSRYFHVVSRSDPAAGIEPNNSAPDVDDDDAMVEVEVHTQSRPTALTAVLAPGEYRCSKTIPKEVPLAHYLFKRAGLQL